MGKKALEVAEQVGCLDAVGETLNIVGTAELRQGNLGGLEKLDHSREIAQQTGDEIGMARAYMHPTAARGAPRMGARGTLPRAGAGILPGTRPARFLRVADDVRG